MEKMLVRTLALLLLVLVGGSIVASSMPIVAGTMPTINQERIEDNNNNVEWWKRLNLTLDEALSLAWIVRNETYDLFIWADNYLSQYNITIARKLLEKGDYFLELAYNTSDTNETLATAYAFTAALFYGRAPITAYIVLGKTIRENVGDEGVTRETVEAVLSKAIELKNLLDKAINIAEDYNITIPDLVIIIETKGVAELNLSQELLKKDYVRPAFAAAVRGYHYFAKAYIILIKATFAEKLGLRLEETLRLSRIIPLKKTEIRERIQRLLERLPEHIREKILEHIKDKKEIDPETFRKAIRIMIAKYRERLENISIEITAKIITKILLIAIILDPTDTGKAILEWMDARNLTVETGPKAGVGRIPKRPDIHKLYLYIRDLVNTTHREYNVTGIALINKTLEILSEDITNVTGIEVDLVDLFYTLIVVHVSIHHRHGHH